MKYIAHRRLKKKAICGQVNIPAMTELDCANGAIVFQGGIVCYEDCETAHQFFARNDDGRGMERGRLTRAIVKALLQVDGQYQNRWDKVWADPICRPYKRADDGHWLWNHAFYSAGIDDLRHIAALVGAKA